MHKLKSSSSVNRSGATAKIRLRALVNRSISISKHCYGQPRESTNDRQAFRMIGRKRKDLEGHLRKQVVPFCDQLYLNCHVSNPEEDGVRRPL